MADPPSPDSRPPRPEMRVFLQEIKSHPDDDTPRLVLADWLQEHGDPREAARGEMIRIQVLLHQLHASDPRQDALRRRQNDLLFQHRDDWVGPLMEYVTWRFERGFLHLTARAPKFLRRKVAALATPEVCAWVEALTVEDLRPAYLRAFAQFPLLPHIHTLDISESPMGHKIFQDFIRSPNLFRLRTLYLDGNTLGHADIAALASSPHLAGLTTLDLSRMGVRDETARVLIESPYLKNLTTLWLGRAFVSEKGKADLRQRFGEGVRFTERRRPEPA
jgi:uncharacterized protein (TIGR02996 family)